MKTRKYKTDIVKSVWSKNCQICTFFCEICSTADEPFKKNLIKGNSNLELGIALCYTRLSGALIAVPSSKLELELSEKNWS